MMRRPTLHAWLIIAALTMSARPVVLTAMTIDARHRVAVASVHAQGSAQQAAVSNGVDIDKASIDAFARLKGLEGKWIGKSTKGWTETISYKVMAGGSVVHEESLDAHPGETMATMFHMDGKRLLLTHYCVAKNQPRLQATSFEDGGKKVTFTFLDATNLASRDKGHMDKVVFKFIDDDHFTSQWTWYQDGKEGWLEEIVHQRVK